MKKIILITSIAFLLLGCSAKLNAQGTAINNTGAAADNSAGLDVDFNNKGFLIPRMTQTERNAIVSPALGLQIFNTTTNCINMWVGSVWKQSCFDCDFNNPVAGSNSPICEGILLNLSATTIPGAVYSWTGPNGFTSSLQNPSIPNATAAASGSYSVTATKDGCTSQPQITFVSVNANPQTPTAGCNAPNCAGQPVNLSASDITGASYTWTGPNGFYSNQQNPVISNAQVSHSGTYTVIAALNGCSSSPGSVEVTVNTIPSSSFTPSNWLVNTSVTFTPVVSGASYNWSFSGGNPSSETSQNPAVTWSSIDTFDVSLTVTKNGCYSTTDSIISIYAPNCNVIKQIYPSSADGVYNIEPDGSAGSAPIMQCYCDMTTDGGGWTLVLNYLHKGGTNPVLSVKANSLPLLGSTTLGVDESGNSTTWGHASNSLMNVFSFNNVRFYGITSNVSRVIHFKSNDAGTISYFKSGTGNSMGLSSSYTVLTGHNAYLPANMNSGFNSQGNYAMTEFPFYTHSNYHWGIRGGDIRWESDEYANGYQYNTYHQIWIK